MDNRRHEKPLCVDLELSKNVETMIQIRMIGTGRVTLPAFPSLERAGPSGLPIEM